MITPSEAFNVIVRYGFCGDCRWVFESSDCVKYHCYQRAKFIKEALEKQIPKKPIIDPVDCAEVCPNCKSTGIRGDYGVPNDYCSECGQAIDWSD